MGVKSDEPPGETQVLETEAPELQMPPHRSVLVAVHCNALAT